MPRVDAAIVPKGRERSIRANGDRFAYLTCHGQRRGLMPTTKMTMANTPLSIDPLLAAMAERNASDLHLTAGSPPVIRVNGKLERLPETDDLELDDIRTLVYRILSTEQQKLLEEALTVS